MSAATPTMMPPPMPPQETRPTGITILAVLDFIGAGFLVLAAIFAIALGGVIGNAIGNAVGTAIPGVAGAAIGAAIAVVLLIFAAVLFLCGWGLWTRKSWAWWLQFIFACIGILTGVLSILQGKWSNIVGLAIDVFLVWYFTAPGVERWFGVSVKVPWHPQA